MIFRIQLTGHVLSSVGACPPRGKNGLLEQSLEDFYQSTEPYYPATRAKYPSFRGKSAPPSGKTGQSRGDKENRLLGSALWVSGGGWRSLGDVHKESGRDDVHKESSPDVVNGESSPHDVHKENSSDNVHRKISSYTVHRCIGALVLLAWFFLSQSDCQIIKLS